MSIQTDSAAIVAQVANHIGFFSGRTRRAGTRTHSKLTSYSLTLAQAGIHIATPTQSATRTLPDFSAGDVGTIFRILNVGTANITLQTSGGKALGNTGGPTSITIGPTGQWVEAVAASDSGTLYWATTYSGGVSLPAPPTPSLPVLEIFTVTTDAYVSGGDGSVSITRSDATTSPLVVHVTITGTATNGTDYTTIGSTLTIPAGASSLAVAVHPIDQGITSGTKTVILTLASDAAYTIGSQSAATVTIHEDSSSTATSIQYLLTSSDITAIQAKASGNTAQWQAFKARLDAQLSIVTDFSYEGDHLPWIGDFAMGYVALQSLDPTTAAAYADKAIGLMLSATRDNIRDAHGTVQFLARGDGSTTAFTLANSTINASTFKVYLANITTIPMTKGPLNGLDSNGNLYYNHFIRVYDGTHGTYTRNIDYQIGEQLDNTVDWSLLGSEPAVGAAYSVDVAYPGNTPLASGYVRSGATLTFSTAPTASQAIFVKYQYTGTNNGYQQTGDGRGGTVNERIDTGYTSRYLRYVAIGYDWLYAYSGFQSADKTTIETYLRKWCDTAKTSGYNYNVPDSNYSASGHYSMRAIAAIALQGRGDLSYAATLKSEVISWHDTYLVPALSAPTTGVATEWGGHWSEAWNYGAMAVRSIWEVGRAYSHASFGANTTEQTFANQVGEAILMECPTKTTIYDGGDGYAYPEPIVDNTLFAVLSGCATDSNIIAGANYVMANWPGALIYDMHDLLFRNPSGTATDPTTFLPTSYQSTGVGLMVSRKDWTFNTTWVTFQCGNLTGADHQCFCQGHVSINRGADQLLITGPAYTGDQTFQDKTTYGNTVVIDDGGAGEQNYRYAQGKWFGSPGCTMPGYEAGTGYVYAKGSFAAAYKKNTGLSDPATLIERSILHIPASDYIVIYDRATTTQASYLKQPRWHFLAAPTVTGDGWVATRGSSKLFGQTYSGVSLTTATATWTYSAKNVYQVNVTNAVAAATASFVTGLQTAASSTSAMDTSAYVASGDGKVEGMILGHVVALFGKSGAVSGGTSYSFTDTNGQTTTHYITDMTPNHTYSLAGATSGTATASAGGILKFTSTGTGSSQSISIA